MPVSTAEAALLLLLLLIDSASDLVLVPQVPASPLHPHSQRPSLFLWASHSQCGTHGCLAPALLQCSIMQARRQQAVQAAVC